MADDRILVAIDDGYAQIKLWGMRPDGTGTQRRLIRSSIKSGKHGLVGMGAGEGGIGAYKVEEGETFTVSDHVDGETTQYDGFHTSPLNRVLITHALHEGGYGGRDVELMVGLPVKGYYKVSNDVDVAKIDAKKANLVKGVRRVSSDAPPARLAAIDVGCQAVSAWVDHMLDDDLKPKGEMKGNVAIVDVGGRTTDIAMIVNDSGRPTINMSQSTTVNVGVLDVYNAFIEGVQAKHEVESDGFTLAMQDAAVRERSLMLFGSPTDVGDVVDDAIAQVEGKIQRIIEGKLRGGAALRSIVFVGGGSALLKRLAEPFRNGHMAPDPEFANARGLYKYRQLSRMRTKTAA